MNTVIEKLSQFLADNQTKLQSLVASGPDYDKNLSKLDGSSLDSLTIHPRDYLVDLLTEWSRQFSEICRELQTNSHSHERCLGIIGWDDVIDKASTTDGTFVTDHTESSLEELRTRYNSLVVTLETQLEETRKEVLDLQKSLDLSKLDGALSNIEKVLEQQGQIQEQKSRKAVDANSHELEQLQSTSLIKEIPKLVRGRPYRIIANTKINENLAEANKAETKVCGECGHTKGTNDMKSARCQPEGESNAHEAERLRLTSSIDQLTTQLHDQQKHNAVFASINDGLVELNRTQANKVRELKQLIRTLRQKLVDKSKEKMKVSKSLRKATKALSSNRKQCEILISKLEQSKKDLSRYCVEDMTSWSSGT